MNAGKLHSRLLSQTQCRRRAEQLALRSEVYETLRAMQTANGEQTGAVFPVNAQVVAVHGRKFFLTKMLEVKELDLKGKRRGAVADTTITWGAAYFPKRVKCCKKAEFKTDAIDVCLCPMEHFTAASDAALAVLASRPPLSALTVDVHPLIEQQRALEVEFEREKAAMAASPAAATDTTTAPVDPSATTHSAAE